MSSSRDFPQYWLLWELGRTREGLAACSLGLLYTVGFLLFNANQVALMSLMNVAQYYKYLETKLEEVENYYYYYFKVLFKRGSVWY